MCICHVSSNLYEYRWTPIGIIDEQHLTFLRGMRNWIRRNTQLIHNKDIQMLHTKPVVSRFIFQTEPLYARKQIEFWQNRRFQFWSMDFFKRFVSNKLERTFNQNTEQSGSVQQYASRKYLKPLSKTCYRHVTGNTFRIVGPLSGECAGNKWIPHKTDQ